MKAERYSKACFGTIMPQNPICSKNLSPRILNLFEGYKARRFWSPKIADNKGPHLHE